MVRDDELRLKQSELKESLRAASEASSRPFEEHGIYPERADVRFMLAMHTTAAPDSPEEQLGGALGISKAFAHVDLYPNRGKLIQPGCKSEESRDAHSIVRNELLKYSCQFRHA